MLMFVDTYYKDKQDKMVRQLSVVITFIAPAAAREVLIKATIWKIVTNLGAGFGQTRRPIVFYWNRKESNEEAHYLLQFEQITFLKKRSYRVICYICITTDNERKWMFTKVWFLLEWILWANKKCELVGQNYKLLCIISSTIFSYL